MKYKLWRAGGGLFLLIVILWHGPLAAGQSPAFTLDNLTIELWPEYDRPEVLVIYQAELSPTTPLPAEVTFQLPSYIEQLHVVAVEQNGSLFEASSDTFALRREAEATFLTLTVPTQRFQFEYYDPEILRREAEIRTFDFQFSPTFQIKQTTFQVQEPRAATGFSLTPEAESSFIGQDGLNYNRVRVPGLTPAEPFALSATYRRGTDALTIQNSAGPPGQNTAELPVEVTRDVAPGTSDSFFGYALIGVGALLFLAAGGSWWWSRRQATGVRATRRRPASSTRRGRARGARLQDQPPERETAAYCYRCGTPLRGDANFCHSCGAERR